MTNNELEFFKNKYNFYKKKTKTKKNILLVDRQRYDATVINSIIALALNKKYKMNVILLSDLGKDNFIINIYNQLGFKKNLKGINYLQFFKYPNIFFYSCLLTAYGVFKTLNNGFLWFINNYKVDRVPFGDLIYDTNVRFNHRYLKPRVDFQFIKLLVISTFRIILISKYLKKYNVNKLVTGDENYSFNGGVALRLSIFRKIPNFVPGRTSDKEFEIQTYDKQKLYLGKDNIRVKNIYKKFLRFRPNINDINKFYNLRKNKLNQKFFWTQKNFTKANTVSKSGLNFIKKLSKIKKKKILYASHAFSDAVHQKGLSYAFKDYYDQLILTLKFIVKNDKDNIWIFRAHPSSKIYGEESIFLKVINKYKSKNIMLCPKNVPIKELYNICDIVVTGSGSVGLEFICEGKQAILAGSSAYSNKEITPFFASSQKEYFSFLKKINFIKNPTIKQINLAKKALYFFESGKFISKKITAKNWVKDKIFKSFFINFFGMGMKYNDYIKLIHNMLIKDIFKSKVFNEIKKLV